MIFTYMLKNAPGFLLTVLALWLVWRGWESLKRRLNDRKRRAWNDLNKRIRSTVH